MIRNIRVKFFFCLSTLIWMPIVNMAQTKIDSVQHLQEVTVTGVRPLIKVGTIPSPKIGNILSKIKFFVLPIKIRNIAVYINGTIKLAALKILLFPKLAIIPLVIDNIAIINIICVRG